MKATEVLMEEHQLILRLLSALEKALLAFPAGKVPPAFFLQVCDFNRGFIDACHHAKEEAVLFPEIEANGLPARRGPTEMMRHEHRRGAPSA